MEMQLRTWGEQKERDTQQVILVVNACASRDVNENVVGVCFVGQDVTGQKVVMDKFTKIQGDYTTIVRSHNSLIPPIFGSDGQCPPLSLMHYTPAQSAYCMLSHVLVLP